MKRTIFNPNKLLSIMFFTSVCIHSMDLTIKSTIKGILQNPGPKQATAFANILIQHPELIATDEREAIEFSRNQTLAHWIVNNMNLRLLEIMYDHGETTSTPITQSSRTNLKHLHALGSSSFLAFCFHIRKLDYSSNTQKALYLKLLKIFLARTPALTIKSRNDGMTPAMAIASSDSDLKANALKILHSHHANAFAGRTMGGDYITTVLLKTQETLPSLESLDYILKTSKKEPNFFSELQKLEQQCRVLSKRDYLAVIIANMQSNPSTNPVVEPKQGTKPALMTPQPRFIGLNQANMCYCCIHGCLCCQRPNNVDHNAFWQNWYQNNLNYANATQWLQAYAQAYNSNINVDDIW